ncbi:hypothetical protein ML401_28565 [Bradyrhizobium sp. 62B]|uniref:hypothetical protein n=1 Tax=Bradyrhizobium sp. 62B TaxID=2898442 RepID=UPI002557CA45|nr:hypothetical protein ML401_28565 [Bradyrhizobium sp. 62B]
MVKLLARKQTLMEQLESDPGQNEREESSASSREMPHRRMNNDTRSARPANWRLSIGGAPNKIDPDNRIAVGAD